MLELGTFWSQLKNLQTGSSSKASPRIQIYFSEEADKAACNFAASIASAYGLLTRKITILDSKCKLPNLDHLFKHKKKL
jgi:hypothetical protein